MTLSTDNPGATFNTELMLCWQGDCDSLICAGGDDDGGKNFNSTITFAPIVDVTYFVYPDGHGRRQGSFVLSLDCTYPRNDLYANALDFNSTFGPVGLERSCALVSDTLDLNRYGNNGIGPTCHSGNHKSAWYS